MSTITELKDQIGTKTSNLVLLSLATYGLYPLMWLYENYKIIDKITKIRTADNAYIIWIAVCTGLGTAFTGNEIIQVIGRKNSFTGDEVMQVIGEILFIASTVLYIIWAFRAKRALQEYALNEHKVDMRMNGIYTFLFNIYYINYCINDLPEAQRKQRILTEKTVNKES